MSGSLHWMSHGRHNHQVKREHGVLKYGGYGFCNGLGEITISDLNYLCENTILWYI